MSPASATRSKPAIGEFELIARLARILAGSGQHESVLVGIGDDTAAALRVGSADLYTTDTMVDGVHFRAGQTPWRDLGWKAMAVNLSDIAAMGGTPLYSLVTLGIPAGARAVDLLTMYRGIREITGRFGGRVVGGDIVRAPVLFVTVAMVGAASTVRGKPALLLRSNARPGDLIAVTGTLGSSSAGLKAMERGLNSRPATRLARSHTRPSPRISEGQALVAAGVRTAMDVSDGLIGDLGKLCDASAVSAVVEAEAIPVSKDLRSLFPDDFLSYALGGGEDYELLFTGPRAAIGRAMAALGPGMATVIGRVEKRGSRRRSSVSVIDGRGRPVVVERAGWDHLDAPQARSRGRPR